MLLNSKYFKIFCRALRKWLPFLSWIRNYSFSLFRGDVIAGLAVGLMVVPQSLAIAAVAGLPSQYGLYSSFPGPFVYCFLGTSKDMNVGPSMIVALVTNRYNTYKDPRVASILAFISGIVLLLTGIIKLGFIVRFISMPVFSAFIASAAICISISLVPDLLGLSSGPRQVFARLLHIFRNIKDVRLGDTILGITCLFILLSIHYFSKRKQIQRENECIKFGSKVLKFVNLAKSALIIILATLVSYLLHVSGYKDIFKMAGELPKGFPEVQSPINDVQISTNQTIGVSEILSSFGAGIGVAPLIMFMESIAVAKALAVQNKYDVDSSQELVAIGTCNVVAAFFGAFPITGTFARSVVNSMSGAATPFSGVLSALIVILAIQYITPVFYFIPMTALAAMVIASVLTMIDFTLPRQLWKVHRPELIPYFAAFCASFYELEVGILAGTIVNICFILHKTTKPVLITEKNDTGVIRLTLRGDITFPCSEYIVSHLNSLATKSNPHRGLDSDTLMIQIDCSCILHIDFTVAVNLKRKINEMEIYGMKVIFFDVAEPNVKRTLIKAGLLIEEHDVQNGGKDSTRLLCYESSV